MGKVIDVRDPQGRVQRERVRVVEAFRRIAERLEAAPHDKLVHAIPIAASAVDALDRQLARWLR